MRALVHKGHSKDEIDPRRTCWRSMSRFWLTGRIRLARNWKGVTCWQCNQKRLKWHRITSS